jgi:putative DNA primase/helicase
MMEASDSEGAGWRSFVSAWWDRFGTAEVGTVDLFAIAQTLEPPLPLGTGNDQSQRVRLGKALPKMRDRIFRCGDLDLRLASEGKYQGAARWRLQIVLSAEGSGSASAENSVRVAYSREGWSDNPHEIKRHEINVLKDAREGREGRECFPDPYACAHAHAHTIEDPGKPSQPSPPSREAFETTGYGLEGAEPHPHHPDQPSRRTDPLGADPPDWLRELDP